MPRRYGKEFSWRRWSRGGFGGGLGGVGGEGGLAAKPWKAQFGVLDFLCEAAAEIDGRDFNPTMSEHGDRDGERRQERHDVMAWRVRERIERDVEHDAV